MTEPVAENAPHWSQLPEADLLRLRICDLGLTIEDTWFRPYIDQLGAELESRGLGFRPVCYLGDEWFSPQDVPAIAIPFYLAHPRLMALEQKMMLEVEGGEPAWFMRLIRHECGHAIEHAYQLHRRRRRQLLFGKRSADYDPDTYRPHPYSRSFVRNLPNWYAQAHPDEDFAETFAVWLDPSTDWRKHYARWRALAKLEYVDELMQEIGRTPPLVQGGKLDFDATRLRLTLDSFYKRRRKLYAADAPDFYDRDLRVLFATESGDASTGSRTAAAFFRRHRKELVDSVARWTGERKVTIEILIRRLIDRVTELGLTLGRDETRTTVEITAWLATLVTNYRFTGRFKRTV